MVWDKMAAILFNRRATIKIPNVLDIPAPTVFRYPFYKKLEQDRLWAKRLSMEVSDWKKYLCIKRSSFHLVFSKWAQDTPEREAIEADGGGDGVQAGTGGCALEANSLKIDEKTFCRPQV